MTTKHRKGTAITVLCVDTETEQVKTISMPLIRGNISSERKVEKLARAYAEEYGLAFVKASAEHVVIKYTMEDDVFFANAKEEIE